MYRYIYICVCVYICVYIYVELENVDWSMGTHTVVVQWFSKTGRFPNKVDMNLRVGTRYCHMVIENCCSSEVTTAMSPP